MGVFAPAVIGGFLLGEVGQQYIGKFRLGGGVHQLNSIPMQLQRRVIPLDAQIAAAENFKHRVSHVGQSQVGDGVDFVLIQIHLKIVFHSLDPRFTRIWAHRPVNSPVTMLHTIITGRYSSTLKVPVNHSATTI